MIAYRCEAYVHFIQIASDANPVLLLTQPSDKRSPEID